MQQLYEPFGSEPDRPPERQGGFNPRAALLTFAFATFVLGGFSFGWLFLANWKLLISYEVARMPIPGGGSLVVPVNPVIGAAPRNPARPPLVIPGPIQPDITPTPE